MTTIQEIRGLLRELLTQTLITAAKSDTDTAYVLNIKAADIRAALSILSEVE